MHIFTDRFTNLFGDIDICVVLTLIDKVVWLEIMRNLITLTNFEQKKNSLQKPINNCPDLIRKKATKMLL